MIVLLPEHALNLFQAGVAAADPYLAVSNALSFQQQQLHLRLNAKSSRSNQWPRIFVIALGKAACAMANAAQQIIPHSCFAHPPLVVTNYDNVQDLTGIEVIGAGHPLPDPQGLNAAQRIAQLMSQTQVGDLVLVLISGGGSALLPYPVDGISLAEKTATTQLLLACGASINQINCVRKHLSQFKGGGLAKLAAPADVHALILSDVLGDDLSSIASGPTVADDTHFADAIAILQDYQVWSQTPATVKTHLIAGAQGLVAETAKSGEAIFQHCSTSLVGSNAISVEAVLCAADKLGYQTECYSQQLTGEARHVAEQLALYAKTRQTSGIKQPLAIVAGGETTVTLGTHSGKGGRNQELALAFALAAERLELSGRWQFLSGGTDGQDGPTDAAGGMVDNHSLEKMRTAQLDPQQFLERHDAYPALAAAQALLNTGATGTNVADLQILLLPTTE